MIQTLSMNPAIDRTVIVPELLVGGMNRVKSTRDEASGKAVNVALVAKALGADVRCVGLLPESGGEAVERRLFESGIGFDFVKTPGALRVNMKLIDESTLVATELNQRGAAVSKDHLDRLTELVKRRAQGASHMALTGSLPPGVDSTYYELLIRELGVGCKIALDAEGAPFRAALRAKPHLVKPNQMELELAMDRKIGSLMEVLDAARQLVAGGIELALVSLGGEGAMLVSADEALFAPALKLTVTSTVGAGDSMLAGALGALSENMPLSDVLRTGAAAASASVMRTGELLVDPVDFQNCLDRIEIRRL